jgi:hypothetical protein
VHAANLRTVFDGFSATELTTLDGMLDGTLDGMLDRLR